MDALLRGDPRKQTRHYLRRPAFSTTLSFQVASLFAARRTPLDDFRAGRVTGVVLEYELHGQEGSNYTRAKDPGCMQDEHEVAVFVTTGLRPVAVWKPNAGAMWERQEVA